LGDIGRIGNLSLADYRDSRTSLGYMAHRQARSRNASAVTGRRALRPARWKGKAYGRRTAPMCCISPPTVVSFGASAIFRTGAFRSLRGGSPGPPPSAQTSSITSDPRKRPMPKANAAEASPITIRFERLKSRDFSPQAACSRTVCSTSTRHMPSSRWCEPASVWRSCQNRRGRRALKKSAIARYGLIMRMQKLISRGARNRPIRPPRTCPVSRFPGVAPAGFLSHRVRSRWRCRDEGAFANSRQQVI